MKKLLPILLVIISLEISIQLECSQYKSKHCGDFNDGFTLKCLKDGGYCRDVQVDSGCKIENDQCVKNDNKNEKEKCKFYDVKVVNSLYTSTTLKMCKKVLIDDGCKVTDDYYCDAESSSSNVKCDFNDDKSHCQKFEKECTDYTDDDCGGKKTEVKTGVTQQCIKLPSSFYCSDIEIDEYCKVTVSGNSYKCEPRSSDFDSNKYICDLNSYLEKPQCKRREKVCTELDISKCEQINNCKAINDNESKTCRLVTIDSTTCKIDNNGNCVIDQGNEDYQKCGFDVDTDGNYKCKASTKLCGEITKTASCENGATIDSNNKCKVLKIGTVDQCVEVKIHDSCKIDNKQCALKTANTNQACKLDSITNGRYCRLYQKDTDCNTGTDFSTCTYSGNNEAKKCVALNENTECRVTDKVCSDYTNSTECDNVNIGNNKKCSWDSSLNSLYNCREYEIDDTCTVTNGDCDKKSDKELSSNKKCLFTNSTKVICKQLDDTCTNYFENCGTHNRTTEKIQCISSGYSLRNLLNCKEVKIDDTCQVDSNTNCVPKGTIDNKKGCYYNKEKTECKIGNKQCKEYNTNTQPTCNEISGCSYINYLPLLDTNGLNYYHCHETETENEQICKIVDHECTKASDTSINSDKEKCLFEYDNDKGKAICKKVSKSCSELSQTICNSVSTDSYKCYYHSGSCLNITLDGNCTMNSEDKCVENGSGKLSSTDMCDLVTYSNSYSGKCYKREKTCSDITVLNDCNSYQPVNRKCFYISSSSSSSGTSSSSCKEIKVDSQCSINDVNECTGKGCSFKDDNKDHCAYKSASSMLKIRMIILALFFML